MPPRSELLSYEQEEELLWLHRALLNARLQGLRGDSAGFLRADKISLAIKKLYFAGKPAAK